MATNVSCFNSLLVSNQEASTPTSMLLASLAGGHNPISTSNGATKATILSAFSGLQLELDARGVPKIQGSPDANAEPIVESASRTLIQHKIQLKEEQALADRAGGNSKENKYMSSTQRMLSSNGNALAQAMNSFQNEVEHAGGYLTQTQRTKVTRQSKASRRKNQRCAKKEMKGSSYEDKLGAKSSRSLKRLERKEKYKAIY